MANNKDKINDLKKKGGNIFGYFKHLVKDPVRTLPAAAERKKELLKILYISLAAFFAPMILMFICVKIFGNSGVYDIISKILTVPAGIGLIGLLFSGFMFMMLFKITTVLKKLECKNCHEQVTYNDSIKYKILREWEEKKVTSNNNGRTNVSQTKKAEVLVTCACQNCGTPKEFKHEFRTANYYNGSLKYSYQIEELIEGMFTGKLIQ